MDPELTWPRQHPQSLDLGELMVFLTRLEKQLEGHRILLQASAYEEKG
jgi:hypothetical protein